MNTAQINQIILRAINVHGYQRVSFRNYRALSFEQLFTICRLDASVLRSALDALCVKTQFTGAPLVHLSGDIYAQRIRATSDYHEVIESDAGMFDVCYYGDNGVVNSYADYIEACDAAERADHERAMDSRQLLRPVDATFHGAHFNSQGEAICLPEP